MGKVDEISTQPLNTYCEQKIGKTLFRVTNEYVGEQNFSQILEDLIVQKILHHEEVYENI